jgi:RNA polymerase sigma factor (TIGR02999 family)
MSNRKTADLTLLLREWRDGNDEAASRLLAAVYGDLRRIAGGYMRGERPSHTLQPTALVHEAWMRLSETPNPPAADREQFFRAIAAYMRRHLVDHARRRSADKRGAGARPVDIDDWSEVPVAASSEPGRSEEEFRRLDAAIAELAAAYPRAARVLELRFFGNRSIVEAAQELGISTPTANRDFAFARSFLVARVDREKGG